MRYADTRLLPKTKPRQTNPFVRSEYFMRQITTFYNNLRLPSKPHKQT